MKVFNSIAAEERHESEQSQLSEASGCDSAVNRLGEVASLLQFACSHSLFFTLSIHQALNLALLAILWHALLVSAQH